MKSRARSYSSPLRAARAQATRERLLAAVATWMEDGALGEFTLDAVAQEAGVERRTVFRHFATKEALLAAFWTWINQRVAPNPLPTSEADLVTAPRETFPRFDAHEGVMRASLHSAAGRAMRLASVPARRAAFATALAAATQNCPPADRRRLEAVAHVLYSAAAWETMRDYAGLTGAEAGDAAAWALDQLIATARRASRRSTQTSVPSPTTTKGV